MANVIIPKKSTVAAKVPGTSDLSLGEIAINHADQKLYARHPVSGTVQEIGGGGANSLSIDTTAADLFSATSGTLSADDLGSDKIYFWDDSAGRATGLDLGTGLAITGTTLNNTGSLTGTGSVDNAILRADGTGGATLQSADISIDDATTSTQNNVAITNQHSGQTNSSLVLTPKGTGAFILGPKPDGTATGGNARGSRAVDLQLERTAATQIAAGANSFAVGASNTVSSQYSMAIGNNNSVTGAVGSGAFGTSNTASGGSFPCFAFGTSNTASGISSIAMGRNCSAGNYSISAGGFSTAGEGSVALGNSAIASGVNSQAFGQSCTANTTYTQSHGEYALANRYGMLARASGSFSGTASGDAQRARFVLRNRTTTGSATELFLDGSSTRLTIPSGKIFAFTINISGVKSDGSAVAHYLRQYCLKNVAGTTSEVYAPVTIGTDNAAGTSIALSANDTNDALKVEVTGIASETWRWVASVDAVEIAYGN